jgi:hypothetical protein
MCRLSRNAGSLKLLEHSGPVQACNGIAFTTTTTTTTTAAAAAAAATSTNTASRSTSNTAASADGIAQCHISTRTSGYCLYKHAPSPTRLRTNGFITVSFFRFHCLLQHANGTQTQPIVNNCNVSPSMSRVWRQLQMTHAVLMI